MFTRRQLLARSGTGLGMLGLAGILADEAQAANPLAPKVAHFPAKAKHVIHLFMNGGPSQVDTFDPKPALEKYHGQQPKAAGLKTERKTGGLFKFSAGSRASKCPKSSPRLASRSQGRRNPQDREDGER